MFNQNPGSNPARGWLELGGRLTDIRPYRGKHPQIAASAYIDPAAVIIGDVVIGEDFECVALHRDSRRRPPHPHRRAHQHSGRLRPPRYARRAPPHPRRRRHYRPLRHAPRLHHRVALPRGIGGVHPQRRPHRRTAACRRRRRASSWKAPKIPQAAW